jgi:hypothetical protein
VRNRRPMIHASIVQLTNACSSRKALGIVFALTR